MTKAFSQEGNYAGVTTYLISCSAETQAGKSYLYIGVDAYSKYIFHLGTFQSFDDHAFRQAVNNLLNDKLFGKAPGQFTLVLGFGNDIIEQIQQQVELSGGSAIYDPKRVVSHAWPIIEKAIPQSPQLKLQPALSA